jgi:hypothetical protein
LNEGSRDNMAVARQEFSLQGDSNAAGVRDLALVGVYEDLRGEQGSFLLILMRQGQRRKWNATTLANWYGIRPQLIMNGCRKRKVDDAPTPTVTLRAKKPTSERRVSFGRGHSSRANLQNFPFSRAIPRTAKKWYGKRYRNSPLALARSG